MKQFRIALSLLIAVSFVITACPVGSAYPLAESSAALPFDKALTGTWENFTEDAEASLVTLEKGSTDNTYNVKVLETGDMYGAETKDFTAWQVALNGKRFLVLKETGTSNTSPYYLYHITVNGSQLITHDVSLLVNGTDAITSVKSYQEELIASMKKEGFLTGKIDWKKK
ncbi:MAG: hypothetical protein IPK57_17335 [Chitinophagaceae bacterium]|nr:hypothetical protein [Chitinophagaceae bacterium]